MVGTIVHTYFTRTGTLIASVEELGHDNVIRFLMANLKEEKAADKKLNTLAEAKLNRSTGTRVAASSVTVKKRTGTSGTSRFNAGC